jgi:hypothetical protein
MESLIGRMSRRRHAGTRTSFTSVNVLPVIQSLEDRRLLSVSAQTLVGPLSAGSTYSYKDAATGQFTDIVVVGPTTFNGQNAIEADTYTAAASPVPRTMPVKNYVAFDAMGQYVQFGTVITDAGGNETLTVTYPTGNVRLPAQLAAGQTYTLT